MKTVYNCCYMRPFPFNGIFQFLRMRWVFCVYLFAEPSWSAIILFYACIPEIQVKIGRLETSAILAAALLEKSRLPLPFSDLWLPFCVLLLLWLEINSVILYSYFVSASNRQ